MLVKHFERQDEKPADFLFCFVFFKVSSCGRTAVLVFLSVATSVHAVHTVLPEPL